MAFASASAFPCTLDLPTITTYSFYRTHLYTNYLATMFGGTDSEDDKPARLASYPAPPSHSSDFILPTTVAREGLALAPDDNLVVHQATHEQLLAAQNPAYLLLFESHTASAARLEQLQANYNALVERIPVVSSASTLPDSHLAPTLAPAPSAMRRRRDGEVFSMPVGFISRFPPGILDWNHILLRSDFPLVTRWTKEDNELAEQAYIDNTSTYKLSGDISDSTLARYFQYEWGSAVGDTTIAGVGGEARRFFSTLNPIPKSWLELSDLQMDGFLRYMYNHYSWLRLCDGHWKAKVIGAMKYRHWKRDHVPKAVKQEVDGTVSSLPSPAAKRKAKDSKSAPGAKRARADPSPSGGAVSPSKGPSLDLSSASASPVNGTPSSPSPTSAMTSPSKGPAFTFAPPMTPTTPSRPVVHRHNDATLSGSHPAETQALDQPGNAPPSVPPPSVPDLEASRCTTSSPPRHRVGASTAVQGVASTATARSAVDITTPKPQRKIQNPIANARKTRPFPTLNTQSTARASTDPKTASAASPETTAAARDAVEAPASSPAVVDAPASLPSPALPPTASFSETEIDPVPTIAAGKTVKPYTTTTDKNLWYKSFTSNGRKDLLLTAAERDKRWEALSEGEKEVWRAQSQKLTPARAPRVKKPTTSAPAESLSNVDAV